MSAENKEVLLAPYIARDGREDWSRAHANGLQLQGKYVCEHGLQAGGDLG